MRGSPLSSVCTSHGVAAAVVAPRRSGPGGAERYDAEGGRLHETASRGNDTRFVLLIPHGGQIEDGTSEQRLLFHAALGSFYGYNIPVSSWRVEGFWGDGQNSKRWHITATSLLEKSFPALQWLLGQPRFSASFPFRRAVALHGFSENDPDVIVGGNTDLNAKCHVATKIKAEPNMGPVAIRIYHEDEIIDIPDNTGRTVCRKGLDGSSSRNIVNRMAAEGGIQIEQSEGVRESTVFRGRSRLRNRQGRRRPSHDDREQRLLGLCGPRPGR